MLTDVRVAHGREQDDPYLRVRVRDLTARLESVDVREIQVEHNHVRLESLGGLQQITAVGDRSYDVAVLRQQAGDGLHHVGVVVRKEHAGSRLQHYASTIPDSTANRAGVSKLGSVTTNVAPPSGLLRAAMVPPCALRIVRTIVRPIPRPCALVVMNGVNSVSMMSGGTPVPVVTYGDFDIRALLFGADLQATSSGQCPDHRVHSVDHQVDEDLLQQHLIAADDARGGSQMKGGLDLPRFHVVGDEGKALVDDAVKIGRLLVQLVTAEHRPMAIDDLRGAEALGLDIGQDLSDRVGRRPLPETIV